MRAANRPASCASKPRDAVDKVIPPPTPAKRREAIQLALADAARYGLTSIQDYSQWEDFLVYEDLEREGKLPVRISEWLPFTDPVPVLQEHRAHHPQTDTMLRTGMLKGFMDGSLGSRTAALLAPYSDDPKNSGLAAVRAGATEPDDARARSRRIPDRLPRDRRSRRGDGAASFRRRCR